MRALYTVLMSLVGLALWPILWLKSRRDPAWGQRIGERLGHIPIQTNGIPVWVHAVSVGEVLAAVPLIRALIAHHGPGQICVTTMTPTGSAQVKAQLGNQVMHVYAPFDVHWAVTRFLDRLQPRQVVIMETELWPTLFRQLKQRGIPLMIANARLSPRSVKGYGRVASFARSVLSDVTCVAAQSDADAERFRQLGAPQVHTLGNIKFDIQPDAAQVAAGRSLRERLGADRPCWIAASTHEGEEQIALEAHRLLRVQYPDALLVLVPRHPPRFPVVAERLADSHLTFLPRSQLNTATAAPRPAVLLGDSMGEMWMYLAMADVAFVGGSLVPVGGHNVLEPAALGLPVLFGPHMHNFEGARDLLMPVGAQTVTDAPSLSHSLLDILSDELRQQQLGVAAKAAISTSQGALARHLLRLDDRSTS